MVEHIRGGLLCITRKRKREALGSPHSSEMGDIQAFVTMDSTTDTDILSDNLGQRSTDRTGSHHPCATGMEHTVLEPRVAFQVGSEIREFPQSKLFSYIWGNGLDSDCMVSGDSFVPGVSAAIRTIGFEYSGPSRPPGPRYHSDSRRPIPAPHL